MGSPEPFILVGEQSTTMNNAWNSKWRLLWACLNAKKKTALLYFCYEIELIHMKFTYIQARGGFPTEPLSTSL